jgi:hypothetical protein
MSTNPPWPTLVRGGIVLIDPVTSIVRQIIVLQYNPDTLTRTLQVQGIAEGGDRSEALRLKGPPIETIKVEAEIDATDQLEHPDQFSTTAQYGIQAQLATLELIVYPSSTQLTATNSLAQSGTLEIAPMETPLPLFIWSKSRILPVRITEFSITEEAFDTMLNPTRAKVSLGMRVLNVVDLGFEHKGGNIYLAYQQQKETLAALSKPGVLNALGIQGIP